MGVARINPVFIEAIHHIIIMYALKLPIIESRKRQAETILIVAQAYLLTAIEHGIDRTIGRGAHQLIVDLQVAETNG